MNRSEKILFLLKDFKKMFPDSNRATELKLFQRLCFFEEKDLDLLVEQVDIHEKNSRVVAASN